MADGRWLVDQSFPPSASLTDTCAPARASSARRRTRFDGPRVRWWCAAGASVLVSFAGSTHNVTGRAAPAPGARAPSLRSARGRESRARARTTTTTERAIGRLRVRHACSGTWRERLSRFQRRAEDRPVHPRRPLRQRQAGGRTCSWLTPTGLESRHRLRSNGRRPGDVTSPRRVPVHRAAAH